MAKDKVEETMQCKNCCKGGYRGGSEGGAVYGLGLIGALVYFLPHVTTLIEGLLAVGKSLIWPALLVYHLLSYFKL